MSYQNEGTNLDSIFAARTSAKRADVNIRENGIDISNLYEPLSNDQKICPVNYESNGTNLSELFMGNASQYTIALPLTTTRTAQWNGNIDTEVDFQLGSASEFSTFFELGGRVIIETDLTGNNQDKETDWRNVFNAAGSIQLGKSNTYRGAPGTVVNSIGVDDLTTSYQLIYSTSGSGAYSSNLYRILARLFGSNGLQVLVQIQDISTGGVDEQVTATVTTSFSYRRATCATFSSIFLSLGNQL